MKNKNYVSLGDLSSDKKLKLTKATLQYWVNNGLIPKSHTAGKTCVYDYKDTLKRIKTIRHYQGVGMTLKEIKIILDETL